MSRRTIELVFSRHHLYQYSSLRTLYSRACRCTGFNKVVFLYATCFPTSPLQNSTNCVSRHFHSRATLFFHNLPSSDPWLWLIRRSSLMFWGCFAATGPGRLQWQQRIMFKSWMKTCRILLESCHLIDVGSSCKTQSIRLIWSRNSLRITISIFWNGHLRAQALIPLKTVDDFKIDERKPESLAELENYCHGEWAEVGGKLQQTTTARN